MCAGFDSGERTSLGAGGGHASAPPLMPAKATPQSRQRLEVEAREHKKRHRRRAAGAAGVAEAELQRLETAPLRLGLFYALRGVVEGEVDRARRWVEDKAKPVAQPPPSAPHPPTAAPWDREGRPTIPGATAAAAAGGAARGALGLDELSALGRSWSLEDLTAPLPPWLAEQVPKT